MSVKGAASSEIARALGLAWGAKGASDHSLITPKPHQQIVSPCVKTGSCFISEPPTAVVERPLGQVDGKRARGCHSQFEIELGIVGV